MWTLNHLSAVAVEYAECVTTILSFISNQLLEYWPSEFRELVCAMGAGQTKCNMIMTNIKSTGPGRKPAISDRGNIRKGSLSLLFAAMLYVPFLAGVTVAQCGQYPLLDAAFNKVIQKYRNSSCEQLWQEREQLRSQREQQVVDFLRSHPQMPQMFIDRVAAPVANKLFECGMIS